MGFRRCWIVAIAVLLALAACYGGYWLWLAGRFQAGFQGWVAANAADGLRLDYRGLRRTGFPARVALELERPAAAGTLPDLDWRWRGERLVIAMPVYRFDRLTIEAPAGGDAVLRSGAGNTVAFEARTARAALSFAHGGPAALRGSCEQVVLRRPEAPAAPLSLARLRFAAAAGRDGAVRPFSVRAERLTGPEVARSALGREVALIALDGDLRGAIPDAPPPEAAAGWRDGGGMVEVAHVELVWGGLRARGAGSLTLDAALQPFGMFALRVAGYGGVIDQLVARREIRPDDADLLRAFLAALAAQKGDGSGVPIKLHVQNGRVWLGTKAVAAVAPLF